ncbi:MAG: FAD-binding protein [Acidimicrobiales bacterium]|nr:FAD-binding protein [Acidimicrobiales bacterium]
MKKTWVNWGKNQRCHPSRLERPSSAKEVADLVSLGVAERQKVRPVGAGHSFSPICSTDGIIIDLSNFDSITDINQPLLQVTVGAGIRLFELNTRLESLGMALPNLGDIDVQTLAGAISTGTHGTGMQRHSISNAVIGMTLITGDGGLVQCSESINKDIFNAARVSLGSFGIILDVTLQCVEAFNLRALERTTNILEVLEQFEDEMQKADHIEFFWFPHTEIAELKVNMKTLDPPNYRSPVKAFMSDEVIQNGGFELINRYGKLFPHHAHRLLEKSLPNNRKASYVSASYKVFCSKRRVRFKEMEYAIPQECLLEAFQRVRDVTNLLEQPVTFPVEVRVLGADDIPLSPAFGRDSGFIAVHVYQGTSHDPYFQMVEKIMSDYGGRPHWGKMHSLTSLELSKLYPRWDNFQMALNELDPDGHFTNPYLEKVLRGPT